MAKVKANRTKANEELSADQIKQVRWDARSGKEKTSVPGPPAAKLFEENRANDPVLSEDEINQVLCDAVLGLQCSVAGARAAKLFEGVKADLKRAEAEAAKTGRKFIVQMVGGRDD